MVTSPTGRGGNGATIEGPRGTFRVLVNMPRDETQPGWCYNVIIFKTLHRGRHPEVDGGIGRAADNHILAVTAIVPIRRTPRAHGDTWFGPAAVHIVEQDWQRCGV